MLFVVSGFGKWGWGNGVGSVDADGRSGECWRIISGFLGLCLVDGIGLVAGIMCMVVIIDLADSWGRRVGLDLMLGF